jgi:aspartate racemase
MAETKHLGLIGGLGVGAAVIYYEKITAACMALGFEPRFVMAHAHAPRALEMVTAGRIAELARYLAIRAEELARAGAEFIAIPAITPHICLPGLTPLLPIPLINILTVTAEGLRRRNLRRISLFGTRFTIEGRMFGALEGFNIVTPEPAEIDAIHRIYLELAGRGATAPENVEQVRGIARRLCAEEGVEAVLIAGTDFNLVFDESTAGFPAFDCAAAHIEAIVARMTNGR